MEKNDFKFVNWTQNAQMMNQNPTSTAQNQFVFIFNNTLTILQLIRKHECWKSKPPTRISSVFNNDVIILPVV